MELLSSVILLGGQARGNWNYIFEDLVLLCEKLEKLGIEAIVKAIPFHEAQAQTIQ